MQDDQSSVVPLSVEDLNNGVMLVGDVIDLGRDKLFGCQIFEKKSLSYQKLT